MARRPGSRVHGVEGPSTDKAGTKEFPNHRVCRDRGMIHYEFLTNLEYLRRQGRVLVRGLPAQVGGRHRLARARGRGAARVSDGRAGAAEPYPRDMVGYGQGSLPIRPGPATPASRCSSSSTTKRALRTRSSTATPPPRACSRSSASRLPRQGERYLPVESMYEFGSRVGFWRLHRLFTEREVPVTVFGVAMALERNPDAVAAMVEAGWEVASHGLPLDRPPRHAGRPRSASTSAGRSS